MKGKLALGTWQQVVLINHEIKARNRVAEVTIVSSRILALVPFLKAR
jgi:thiamine phosphate synthase YjbQ (UPF0047 family)